MIRIIRKPARVVFAVAVLGSLGFGVSQALAAQTWPTDPTPLYCGPDCEYRERMGCVCW